MTFYRRGLADADDLAVGDRVKMIARRSPRYEQTGTVTEVFVFRATVLFDDGATETVIGHRLRLIRTGP